MRATGFRSLYTALLTASFALHGASGQDTTATPAVVTIGGATLQGTSTNLPSATASVNKFLGVPFAQSPPERFSPPQPATYSGKVDATSWKPSCPQQFVYPLSAQTFTEDVFNEPPPKESEDCLYLNVYAPSSPAPPGGRTVMYWIYGGALEFGNAGQPAYDGSAFAAYQDVILVSVNYRTNVFGFPNSPELPRTGQNLGLLDQRAGLEWVQKYIHLFGGDPAKVTIFGESAGAESVDFLLTSYSSNAPFRGAILESGQASYHYAPLAPSTASWEALTAGLNCTGQSSNLTCVRAASVDDIKMIIDQQMLVFNPVADDVTLLSNPGMARASGNFAKVPVLGGTNAQEGRVFEFGQTNLSAFLQTTFATSQPDLIPTLQESYAIGNSANGIPITNDYDATSAVFTDIQFQCPQALWANESSAQGQVPTWRYLFNATFPNTQSFGALGVFHSSEIQLVFQTYPGGPVNALTPTKLNGIIPSNVSANAAEYALAKTMNTAWATFAKNPQGGPGWNELGTFDGNDLGVLGAYGSSGVTMINAVDVDERCSVYFPLFKSVDGALPGLG
ncbi:MAG: hypothetical protein M1828_007076 [Chrysothrix sp. TS-e1954]|nr:MAG: hypothetical protein M1828_007076 [Chrysothrix sp. TS-e1954]